MDNERLQQPEEEAVAEQELIPNTDGSLKEQIEALRADIAALEEKEAQLTEKLCLAKEMGLAEQTDRCRELLQKMVLQKIRKRDELKELEVLLREEEAKRMIAELSAEIDAVTAEIEGTVLEEEVEEVEEEEYFEAEYDHLAKSRRLSVISRVFAWMGVLGGLVGALVYTLYMYFTNTEMQPIDLAVFGGVLVVFVVIALFIGGASNRHKRLAAQIEAELEEKRAAAEAARLERERIKEEQKAAWKCTNMDAVAEAYAIEQAMDKERAKKPIVIPGTNVDLGKAGKLLKKNVHKVAPVAAVCGVAVAVAAAVSTGKKVARARRAEAARREFFKWLG